jgi:hypothetical protein
MEAINSALKRGSVVRVVDSNIIMTTGSEALQSSQNCIERNEMQAKVLRAFFTSLLGWDADLARRNWRELTNAKGKSSSVP